jgi:hypothetical protein
MSPCTVNANGLCSERYAIFNTQSESLSHGQATTLAQEGDVSCRADHVADTERFDRNICNTFLVQPSPRLRGTITIVQAQ